MVGSATELAQCLARDPEAVCRTYLSNGCREGAYWRVGDAANTPGRSLYVRLGGSGSGAAGKWTDAATGEHGDLLDIVRLSRNLSTVVAAMDEARLFLTLPEPAGAPHSPPARRSSPEAARRLYAMGRQIRGTLAHDYLLGRGVTADLSRLPLRFHPCCYYQPEGLGPRQSRPALLAAVTDLHGMVVGLHRTWLDPAQATKADLPTPRKAMGRLLGNGVRFGHVLDVLLAGEGLETVLSLRTIMPAMPMVAALSAAHLAAFLPLAGLRRLYVARDDDLAGRQAVERLQAREDLSGIDLRVLTPMQGDFNEDLRRRGAETLAEWVRPQLACEDAARFLGTRDHERR